ncbi:MAG: hypothetical protein JRJ46_08180 [Deltaproteobacteria bacterium]|nr:hypothetical protein [Deltaproteobacteria bacterium]
MKKRLTTLLTMVLLTLFLAASAMVFAAEDFQPLIGRWQRTDAGYVIEIRSIAPDGKITAGYYNPRPINVEQAQASMQKDHIKVEVTLRDQGYPGSAYTLVYAPDKDALFGYYYHAVSGQHFEVVFFRVK